MGRVRFDRRLTCFAGPPATPINHYVEQSMLLLVQMLPRIEHPLRQAGAFAQACLKKMQGARKSQEEFGRSPANASVHQSYKVKIVCRLNISTNRSKNGEERAISQYCR